MKFSNHTLALLSLAFVALGYTLLSVAARFLAHGFSPFTQVYLRIGLGFVLACILFRKDIKYAKLKAISRKDWIILIIMGSFGYGLAVDMVTLGVLHTKLLNVSVITSTVPFFVFLYSFFFLRKHLSKILFLIMLIGVYGVIIIATRSFLPTLNHFGLGEFYSLLFAAGTACYSVCRRFVSKSINSREITLIVMFIAFICSLVVSLMARERLNFAGFSNSLVLIGLGMGLSLNFINTHLENFGFQYVKPVIGSQFLLLENVFAPILGFLLFKELVAPIEIFGAVLVVMSVIAANNLSSKE